jgi:hypothetical protein
MARQIGIQHESSLHAALKIWYATPGDLIESEIDGYLVDIVRGNELIEIQTGNFTNIKRKVAKLLEAHSLRLVYPLPVNRWILRVDKSSGEVLIRRKSPKKGRLLEIFSELVYIPHLFNHPNFSFEIILVEDELVYVNDGLGSWRRKGWSILDRRLLRVVDQKLISKADFFMLLPATLPEQFSARELAVMGGFRPHLAQKVLYTLFQMGILERSGKRGRAWLYSHKLV